MLRLHSYSYLPRYLVVISTSILLQPALGLLQLVDPDLTIVDIDSESFKNMRNALLMHKARFSAVMQVQYSTVQYVRVSELSKRNRFEKTLKQVLPRVFAPQPDFSSSCFQ